MQASTSINSKAPTAPPVTAEIEELHNSQFTITQTLIHGKGKKVKENTLIGSFEKWWPTYEIRFEVKIDSFGSKPGFLLLFTDKNGDCRFSCSSGQYIPAVFTSKCL